MTQSLYPAQPKLLEFSIGICAADHATNLKKLLELIEHETYPEGLMLSKVVVVASGCDPLAVNFLRQLANHSSRFMLIREEERRGKSEAINQIVDSFHEDFLVLVNSDAMPERGAISKLLDVIVRDENIGVVSASPVLEQGSGITCAVLQLLWAVHNECLLTLNARDQNNHCCDELVVVRASALHKLPTGTVNDGAFLAGAAYQSGYTIRFCERARVKIDVPEQLVGLVQQRRRILYGHRQIRQTVGQSPRTVESLLADRPRLGLSILVKTISRSPKLSLALPFAVIGETISMGLAMLDSVTSTSKHATWDRVGSRS